MSTAEHPSPAFTLPPVPRVTVIVPVFNDARGLHACLAALAAQTYAPSRREVVVVDNGSTDDVAAVVARFAGMRKVDEHRPGSYAARNRGIASAEGDVLAFTDADCLPRPDWIERGIARLKESGPHAILGGRVEVFPSDREHATAVELYEMATALRQQEYVERGGFAATANLFVPRAVFAEVGSFEDSVQSGGDVEWGQRAAAAGYRLGYAADVRVRHPARATLRELRRRTCRIIGGVHALGRTKRCRFLGIDRNALLDLVPPLRHARVVWRHPELRTFGERLRVIAILIVVRYLEAWERWRLRCGGTPQR
ncbi:MAG: glycosyltransferase [Planctomycetes bacterium]|nr:glycosyltransferase [Planctomycetota bacterium]